MIEGYSIAYFGPEPWEGMWRNRHHLMSQLARANRVLYLEPLPYLQGVVRGLRGGQLRPADLRRPSIRAVGANLWVYRWPLWAPYGGGPLGRPVTRTLRRLHLRWTLARLGMSAPIVWASHPDHVYVYRDLPARLRVYHIVDEYLGYLGVPPERLARWAAAERTLIAWADRVIVVSEELLRTKGTGNPKFRLLPNAVDAGAYAAEQPTGPAPLLDGLPRPILGYIGLICARLDLAMLDALAAAHGEYTLALIGEVYAAGCEAELARLRARPNVRLLPPVPAAEVPNYVRRFDLGLVPYRITLDTRHASPLKLYEYLAAGLPVVSADVPGARPFAPVMTLLPEAEIENRADRIRGFSRSSGRGEKPAEASSPEERASTSRAAAWGSAIAAALAANTPAAAAVRQAAIAAHTWDARVETLSGYLAEALTEDRQLTIDN